MHDADDQGPVQVRYRTMRDLARDRAVVPERGLRPSDSVQRLEALAEQLRLNTKHTYDLLTRLRTVADHIFGSEPHEGEDGHVQAEPESALGRLTMLCEGQANLLGQITSQVERLESL